MSSDTNHQPPKKYPWTAQRILVLVGILLLLAMYGSTMVFALMGSPDAKGLLMGSIFLTIAVPVLLYAMILVAKRIKGKGVSSENAEDHSDTDA